MPKASAKRSATKRKRSKSTSGKRARRKLFSKKKIARAIGFKAPFPNKKYCSLVYAQVFNLDGTAVAPTATKTFRANSTHDPDYSGTGHQPRHRDALAAIYNRYVVVSSKIYITMFAPASSSQGQLFGFVGIRGNSADTISTVATWANLIENGGVRLVPIGSRDGGTDVRRFKMSYSTRKLYGKNPYMEDDFHAVVGASPSTSPVFIVGVTPANGTDDLGVVRCTVKIIYKCMFYRKHDNQALEQD